MLFKQMEKSVATVWSSGQSGVFSLVLGSTPEKMEGSLLS